MSEEKPTVVRPTEKTEEKPRAEIKNVCPFCGGSMKVVDTQVLREGKFVTKECVKCGFKATFEVQA